jgi:hypothetical protein
MRPSRGVPDLDGYGLIMDPVRALRQIAFQLSALARNAVPSQHSGLHAVLRGDLPFAF